MQVTVSEFEAISNALDMLPSAEQFKELTEDEQNTILNADMAMISIWRRHKLSNRRTAEYIAKRRKLDPNYGR